MVEREGAETVIRQRETGPRTFRRHPRVDPTTGRLEEFAGRYTSDELGISYDLQVREEHLFLHSPHSAPRPPVPVYPDGFGSQGLTVRFMRNASGGVTGLRVFAGRARDVLFHKEPTP